MFSHKISNFQEFEKQQKGVHSKFTHKKKSKTTLVCIHDQTQLHQIFKYHFFHFENKKPTFFFFYKFHNEILTTYQKLRFRSSPFSFPQVFPWMN